MLSTASALPLRTLALGFAPSALGEFVQDFDQVFAGLTPFLLFAGPVVVLLFRHRPLVWLISSSTVAYLAVMSVPLLAFPYVYLTYLEILHVPIRNVIFFVYLLAGTFVYVTVVAHSASIALACCRLLREPPVARWRCLRHSASIGVTAVSWRR